MPGQSPHKHSTSHILGLGNLVGFEYENGVRQYCGIPYATLSKRWTRSVLCTKWPDDQHDGTKLGHNCPYQFSDEDDSDELVPVPPFPHFDKPTANEKLGLVMNIVVPPSTKAPSTGFPVIVYVHGGSFLFGGANLAIFDAVNLVSRSVSIGEPVIVINFNYRVGLGGFLAGRAIGKELAQDGHSGCGNFGLTDQQVAFQWVQAYISYLGGDADQVTAVGESAGGISISHQLIAREHPTFRRAICMSGLSCAIPSWTIEEHDRLFQAVCRYFDLDHQDSDILEELRMIPEEDLANATPGIQGVIAGTGNPCLDGVFHIADPNSIHKTPSWIDAFMIGDTYHEGVIFHMNVMNDGYGFFRTRLLAHIRDDQEVDRVLGLYGINSRTSERELLARFEHLAGDVIFKIPNYATACKNSSMIEEGRMFTYHFDQRSRIKNSFEGTAYHAHELLYLFGNLEEAMNDDERRMVQRFGQKWIEFAYGQAPWRSGHGIWNVWGPDTQQHLVTEAEDEGVRRYRRMGEILGDKKTEQSFKNWLLGIDAVVNKRERLGRQQSVVR